MSEKIPVGVLGATGMVGQNYITLLENHPWFEVNYVAASPRSAGKKYKDAVAGRWHMNREIPKGVENLVVRDANDVKFATGWCSFVFSALELDKDKTRELESAYAKEGIGVVSNSSAHRWTLDVPMLIPEINSGHLDIIPVQQRENAFKENGFIVVKPNCSLQSYLTPIYALMRGGYNVKKAIITTMQAVSGAGYPGVASLNILDNIVPYIQGEEEKSELEPLKILGKVRDGKIINYGSLAISAHCNRVPVIDGHMACVSLDIDRKRVYSEDLENIIEIWRNFKSVPQELGLPSAPEHPIIYRDEIDRPQTRKDRYAENGMAVSVGRLRGCRVLNIRFVGLSHNTIRGAAGGGILNAELMKARGMIY